MPVIEYRRGERFDRVIIGKNEDQRASTLHVKLNTYTHKATPTTPAPSVTVGLPKDRSLADALREAVEQSAQKSDNATLKDLFRGPADVANRTHEEAKGVWDDVANQSRKGTKPNFIMMLVFAFIAFQVLRAIFG